MRENSDMSGVPLTKTQNADKMLAWVRVILGVAIVRTSSRTRFARGNKLHGWKSTKYSTKDCNPDKDPHNISIY